MLQVHTQHLVVWLLLPQQKVVASGKLVIIL